MSFFSFLFFSQRSLPLRKRQQLHCSLQTKIFSRKSNKLLDKQNRLLSKMILVLLLKEAPNHPQHRVKLLHQKMTFLLLSVPILQNLKMTSSSHSVQVGVMVISSTAKQTKHNLFFKSNRSHLFFLTLTLTVQSSAKSGSTTSSTRTDDFNPFDKPLFPDQKL